MRLDHNRLKHVMTIVAFILFGAILLFTTPDKAFAEDEGTSLQERHVWFTYGYTECTGDVHQPSKEIVSSTDSVDAEFPRNYKTNMMLCDTKHVIHVEGDGVTDDNVSIESLNPTVLDVDSNGNVTIKSIGTAKIKATVSADDKYEECIIYLGVKADKHEAWSGSVGWFDYVDQPSEGLDLFTTDGPHQIDICLRPGAKVKRFISYDVGVAYVNQNGLVTPVSEGHTMIYVETDDGGGRYKSSGFANFINVTGEDVLQDQEITGDLGPFEISDYRDGFQLDLHAETELEYSISDDNENVTVDKNGLVEFTKPGFASIRVIAPPNETYKAAEKTISINAHEPLAERHAWFTYGYKECTETVHPLSKDVVDSTDSSDTEFPRNYAVTMKSCDSAHALHVEGDGVTDSNVVYESMNPSVLTVDGDGNVTIMKEGTAKITATIAADDTYDDCTLNLYVKVDKHSAWNDSDLHAYYVDRPHEWYLDLDTSDGPHQIVNNLRPGAHYTRFSSSDISVAYVDQNGVVTPVSAGETTIYLETDDGGGKYTPCAFGTGITITGEAKLKDQKIIGNLGPFRIEDYRDGFQLDLHAETPLEYYSIGSDSEYVSVDQNGFVTFTERASGIIHVVAPPNGTYKPAEAEIRITALDHPVLFKYGCTECDGTVRPCTGSGISCIGSGANKYYSVDMMMCDTNHILRVTVDGNIVTDSTLTSMNPEILEVDGEGKVTLKDTGTATIKAVIPGGAYADRTEFLIVNVDRHSPYYSDAPIYYSGRGGKNLDLDVSDGAQKLVVPLRPDASVLSYASGNPKVATVDKNGVVTPVAAGHTTLRLSFDNGGGKYKTLESPLLLDVTVTGKVPDSDQTTPGGNNSDNKATPGTGSKQTTKKTALQREIAKAKSLKRPSFKAKARKGHKIKLTWGKVKNADGYIVYVKYPGTKKFVKAVKRNSTVKSVVHKGLSKGRIYRYKVRAFKKVNGKTYYGKFSKVRKVRAK